MNPGGGGHAEPERGKTTRPLDLSPHLNTSGGQFSDGDKSGKEGGA